jgi:hypothetical protein
MPLEAPKGKSKNPLLEKILQSDARKKILVSGPGTGKTFIFKELLKAKRKKASLDFLVLMERPLF